MFRQHNVGGGALQQEGPGSGSSYVDSGCKFAVCVCVCVGVFPMVDCYSWDGLQLQMS